MTFGMMETLEADHPNGRLVLTMVMLQGLASPGIRFNAYLPADAATASALGLGERGAAGPRTSGPAARVRSSGPRSARSG